MTDFRRLDTKRLRLRAVSVQDLDEFAELHANPALYRHEPHSRHPDRQHSASVLAGLVSDWDERGLGYWTVRATDDQYLGCAGVRRNEANWNVYYRLRRSGWGNGYAAEVIRVAARCAESVEPGAALQASLDPGNGASAAVARALGMSCCGTQLDVAGHQQLVFQLPAALISPARA